MADPKKEQGPKSGREAPPSFQFYPQDFLGSPKVRRMTPAEIGHYVVLLCDCWNAQGLPMDHQELADGLGLELDEFEGLWAGRVGRCFEEREGRYWNPRMLREWERLTGQSKAAAEAGRKGAAARRAKEEERRRAAVAEATLEPPYSDPEAPLEPPSSPPSGTPKQPQALSPTLPSSTQHSSNAREGPAPAAAAAPPSKSGAGSALFTQVLRDHLARSAAPKLVPRLEELVEAHGVEPVKVWLQGLVKAWQAKPKAGGGLLIQMVLDDPFSEHRPTSTAPALRAWTKPDWPEAEPLPYPPSLEARLAMEDRSASVRLRGEDPVVIAAALRDRYPDDPAWAHVAVVPQEASA